MPKFPDIDKYAGIRSPLHVWDPRVKIVSILFLILSTVLVNDVVPAVAGLITSIALILFSRMPADFIRGYMRWITPFVFFLFITITFTVPGEEFLNLNVLSVSYPGVKKGILIAIRALSATLLALAIVGTTKFDQILKAMEKLRIPNKVIQTFMFTYRYIFVFTREIQRMLISLKARGFRKRTDFCTLTTIGNSIGMLFVRSYGRSKRVYWAMISRGYSGTVNSLVNFEIKNSDYMKGALIMVLAVSLHVL